MPLHRTLAPILPALPPCCPLPLVCRDPKLHRAALLTSFARRRPDLLYVMEAADVAALAWTELAPRDYRDKQLLNASGRLRSSFAAPSSPGGGGGGVGSAPGGRLADSVVPSASLQDLLRVVRDWAEVAPREHLEQHAPGERAHMRGGGAEGLMI